MPRIFDFILSLITLLILLPVIFIPIIIILSLTGEHKVFYLQTRVGYKNRNFKIIKMVLNLILVVNLDFAVVLTRSVDVQVTVIVLQVKCATQLTTSATLVVCH